MAQQDCGQCGYLCETYSKAIADGAETKLNLCVPGGKETSRMLKRLLEETPARTGSDPAGLTPGHNGRPSTGGKSATLEHGVRPAGSDPQRGTRDAPVEAIFRMATRLNGKGSAEGHAPRRARHRRQRARLRARRQLRHLPQERSGTGRCGARGLGVPARFPDRRQAHPRRADRGLLAGARPRHAVRADELSRRRRAAREGQGARQGRGPGRRRRHPRRAGGAGEARSGPPRSRGVRRMPGAAAAAALLHRLLSARHAQARST